MSLSRIPKYIRIKNWLRNAEKELAEFQRLRVHYRDLGKDGLVKSYEHLIRAQEAYIAELKSEQ